MRAHLRAFDRSVVEVIHEPFRCYAVLAGQGPSQVCQVIFRITVIVAGLERAKSLSKHLRMPVETRSPAPCPFDDGLRQNGMRALAFGFSVQDRNNALGPPKSLLPLRLALIAGKCVGLPESSTSIAFCCKCVHEVAHGRIVEAIPHKNHGKFSEQLKDKTSGIAVAQVGIAKIGTGQDQGLAVRVLRFVLRLDPTVEKGHMAKRMEARPREQRCRPYPTR